MSFILDALRKVDRESRQADEVVPPVAAVEKLRREKQHRRRQFAAMAAIAVVSAAATTLLMRRPPRSETPSPTQQATATEAPVETPPDIDVVDVVEADVAVDEPPLVVPDEAAERSVQQAVEAVQAEPLVQAAAAEAPPEDPAPEPEPELPQLVLQGTSVLSGKPVAVVSDRRVFEGDTIEGAVVVRIEERLVELEFEGRRFTLTF